jgi:hypothetical protein
VAALERVDRDALERVEREGVGLGPRLERRRRFRREVCGRGEGSGVVGRPEDLVGAGLAVELFRGRRRFGKREEGKRGSG